MRIVITGANRGIGLELTRQYLSRGETLDVTARDPSSAADLQALAQHSDGRLRIHACDVRDDASVRRFERELLPGGVDLLINNAGVMGKMQSLEELELEDVINTIETNALGALRVTRAVLPRMRLAPTKKIAHITSGMGSIGDNTSGGAYGYRMSKAALNMANKSMSVDLANEGFVCIVLNPGWVQTDMGGRGAPTPVEESAAGLIRVIDGASREQNGSFLNRTGETYQW